MIKPVYYAAVMELVDRVEKQEVGITAREEAKDLLRRRASGFGIS
jgi:hypothetical protein